MLHVLDVRDAMDSERFQQVQFDPVNDPKNITHSNSALSTTGGCEGTSGDAAKNEGKHQLICAKSISHPSPFSLYVLIWSKTLFYFIVYINMLIFKNNLCICDAHDYMLLFKLTHFRLRKH